MYVWHSPLLGARSETSLETKGDRCAAHLGVWHSPLLSARSETSLETKGDRCAAHLGVWHSPLLGVSTTLHSLGLARSMYNI